MSLYDDLGLGKDASKEEIRKAYRRKASEHHPDKDTGNKEKFQVIQHAYDILGDEQRRKRYDSDGTENEQLSIQGQARQQVTVIILKILEQVEPESINMIEAIERTISQGEENAKNAIRTGENKLRKFNQALKRFKQKKKGVNYIALAIESVVRQHKQQLEGVKEQLEIMKEMRKILSEYEYEFTKQAQSGFTTTSMFFQLR